LTQIKSTIRTSLLPLLQSVLAAVYAGLPQNPCGKRTANAHRRDVDALAGRS